MSYPEALAWLYGLQRFGIKLGLENIQRLIAGVHVDLGGARVIHVAGTNGKGSVCAMIDSILRAQKYRTGLFVSPHLVTFRERIRVNGEMISEDAVANGLMVIRDLVRDWDPHPTFFEITAALALKHFSSAKVDIVILETGLGGRLDATNAVQSDLSVITPIAFDHQQWLGQSLREIACEKAGIIKPRIPVVAATQAPDAEKVIRDQAAECQAPLQFVNDSYHESPVGLSGEYQKQNAALAIAALRAARIDINHSSIESGLASIDWPGRFQHWDDRIVIDGAHNPAAARIVAQTWQETFGNQRASLILAILSDKDLRGICEALAPIADSVLLPKIRSERATTPDELAKVLSVNTPTLPYSTAQSVADAFDLARAKPNPILLTGSLHFVGETIAWLQGRPAAFEECAQ
ncbi:MAG: bifunctional folylpolyglutamate synthase/dihydrofolate synthase [Verrucomicrobia bacterium]|nr:MAG: bifunctional folylpolyglutamate synthase/dihydrofolate synthase [Verrucomicrobiota bacterium]